MRVSRRGREPGRVTTAPRKPGAPLRFTLATEADIADLVALHAATAADLTARHGIGHWSGSPSERSVELGLRHAKVVLARRRGRLAGSLRLLTRKPWAIDTAYFTPVARPLYLIAMAVKPALQRQGI